MYTCTHVYMYVYPPCACILSPCRRMLWTHVFNGYVNGLAKLPSVSTRSTGRLRYTRPSGLVPRESGSTMKNYRVRSVAHTYMYIHMYNVHCTHVLYIVYSIQAYVYVHCTHVLYIVYRRMYMYIVHHTMCR